MRFPAEEMGQEKREARMATLEMTQSIMELITSALGLEEGEPLPEDVVTDILSKYSFLDPTDVQKWMRLSSFLKPVGGGDEDEGGDDSGDDFDFGGGDDTGGDDMGGGDDTVMESAKLKAAEVKKHLRERKARITELQQKRLREVSNRYKEAKDGLFIKFVESQHLTEWAGNDWIPNFNGEGGTVSHKYVMPKISENDVLNDTIKVLNELRTGVPANNSRLSEQTVGEKMQEVKDSFTTEEEAERRRKVEEQIATDILTGGIGE
jgi:hypothetical protein